MRLALPLSAAFLIALLAGGTAPARAQTPAAAQTPAVVLLDTVGSWRIHDTLSAPVILNDGQPKPFPFYSGKQTYQVNEIMMWAGMIGGQTAAPETGWMKTNFDDASWVRATAIRACRTPYLEHLCLRGKFTVTDPAKIQDLNLALTYHGGAVVYVNGQELARRHLAPGAALADPYPAEAFVDDKGKLITLRGDDPLWKTKPAPELAKRIASRERSLTVPIPATSLHPGVNVVAIELLRAPYDKVVGEQLQASDNHGAHNTFDASWNTCQIRQVLLTAASAAGLVPNATRPAGFQVWNSDPINTDYNLDFGDPTETLHPITLVAARNGTYSGKIVLGSDKPIEALTAAATALTGSGGIIPASNILIRYAAPWGNVVLSSPGNNELLPYPAEPTPLTALDETAPKIVPVYKADITPRCATLPGEPTPVFGAVVPIWATVSVPATIAPGVYSGQIAITATGLKTVNVPLTVKVLDWTLPDPAQGRTWMELIEVPDTTAIEYQLPLWSPKHWNMIDKALTFCGQLGSKVLFVPLIAQSNAGNAESMVRWIKKGDTYDYDFSIMDKYLDIAEKRMGKPAVVIFNVWDRFEKQGWMRGTITEKIGPEVTCLDASGKTENVRMPTYADPANRAPWKALFEQLRARMAKRGIQKAMELGMVTDFWASNDVIEAFNDISGNLPWASAGHYFNKDLYNGLANFGYQSSYFGTRFGYGESLHGWNTPDLRALFERVPLDWYPLVKWRNLPEQSITGSVRGLGRMGGDAWFAVKDKQGRRRARAWERYPGADWGYLNANCSALAPGPEGPVATADFEALREGRQECEAIITLEAALLDKTATARLGPDLAKRCQAALDERRAAMWRSMAIWQLGANYDHELTSWRERACDTGYIWFLGSNWQDRSQKLYALAGEVTAKLGQK